MEKELEKKVTQAIELLKKAGRLADAMKQPLEISYSGGKDSDIILALAKMAGVNFRAIYKNTTIDPPGTISHVKANGVNVIQPSITFAQIIQQKGFPTRLRRFCCYYLKEYRICDVAVQGIRSCESVKRSKRYKEPTVCRLYRKNEKKTVQVFLPILNWSNKDVENFIKEQKISCHKLYYNEKGVFNPAKRLGCMGCPMKSDNGLSDFKRNPRLVRFWIANGLVWWNTHKLKKTKRKFPTVYDVFVSNVFFHNYQSYKLAVDGLFGRLDCKDALEKFFGIKLP